mgnify:CR=1 FL=1
MNKLVIFDLDGTLIDTIEDIAGACNHALEACGCPPRRLEEYNMLVGRGIFNLFRGALPEDRRSEEMVRQMHSTSKMLHQRFTSFIGPPYLVNNILSSSRIIHPTFS